MAPPLDDRSSELNIKWFALRQKHQADTKQLQSRAVQDRKAFVNDVETAPEGLIGKHCRGEANATKTVISAVRSARTGAVNTAENDAAPLGTTTPPASRLEMPNRPQNIPVTPVKATQVQLPPAIVRAPRTARAMSHTAIINLTSDDEEVSPVPQYRRTRRPALVPQCPVDRSTATQDLMDIDQVQNSTHSPSILGASLTLSRDEPPNYLSMPTSSMDNKQKAYINGSSLSGLFAGMDMAPQMSAQRFHNSSMVNRAQPARNAVILWSEIGAHVCGPQITIRTQQFPTAPPRSVSIVNQPAMRQDYKTSAYRFPACALVNYSSRQTIGAEAHHFCASISDSRASGSMIPNIPHSPQTASNVSGLTDAIQCRKRKRAVILSGDEESISDSESNFASRPLDSPTTTERTNQIKKTHPLKKTKTHSLPGTTGKATPRIKNTHGSSAWNHTRSPGNRMQSPLPRDADSQPDISEYTYAGGSIIRKATK